MQVIPGEAISAFTIYLLLLQVSLASHQFIQVYANLIHNIIANLGISA